MVHANRCRDFRQAFQDSFSVSLGRFATPDVWGHVLSPRDPANNMAASNYYGYTSGGQHSQAFTQVQNPSIQSTYGTPQSSSGYAVPAAAPTAGHYVPQQTPAPRQVVQPSGYSAAGSTAYGQNSQAQGGAYGYTARQQDAPPPPPPSNTSFQASHGSYQHHGTAQGYYEREAYDSKGSYYASQPSSTVQTGQSAYYAQGASGAAKTAYPSSGAPAYSSPASAAPVIAKSHPQSAYTSQSSTVAYPYSSARTQSGAYNHSGSFASSNYGGPSSNNPAYHTQAYESVVYNAAQAYVHQQHQHQPARNQGWKNNKPGGLGGGAGPRGQMKPKPPPKQPQIHYCDVCKISCAGPQVSCVTFGVVPYLSKLEQLPRRRNLSLWIDWSAKTPCRVERQWRYKRQPFCH